MLIEENKSLKEYNTFGINSIAKYFISIETKFDLIELVKLDIFKQNKIFVLGGGSNVLMPDHFDGLVINIDIKGINVNKLDDYTILKVSAGEDWHNFVEFTVENKFYGFENLALIPGKVGAAPIQNIGAYGVEQNEYFLECECFDLENSIFFKLDKVGCEFGYRDSIFKNNFKNKVIITEVSYRLNNIPTYNITYLELKNAFQNKEFTSRDIFDLVCKVRKHKLPDPNDLGNSGSFFKNPIISKDLLNDLLVRHPNIKYFEYSDSQVKCSAGWLIEHVGLKGYRKGDAGVSVNHSLILVNYGNAKSKDILEIANLIIHRVLQQFKIKLEMEVNKI